MKIKENELKIISLIFPLIISLITSILTYYYITQFDQSIKQGEYELKIIQLIKEISAQELILAEKNKHTSEVNFKKDNFTSTMALIMKECFLKSSNENNKYTSNEAYIIIKALDALNELNGKQYNNNNNMRYITYDDTSTTSYENKWVCIGELNLISKKIIKGTENIYINDKTDISFLETSQVFSNPICFTITKTVMIRTIKNNTIIWESNTNINEGKIITTSEYCIHSGNQIYIKINKIR